MALQDIFNKYAGKEIDVAETTYNTHLGPRTSVNLTPSSNTVIDELQKELADAGLKLRLWLPGSAGTDEYRSNRVNVTAFKEADGKYRLRGFDIG